MSYPEIYNASGDRLAILNNITSNKLMRKVNSYYEFDFSCFEEEFKTEYITLDNYVIADNDSFDIASISVNHNASGQIKYDVKCEHVFYRLTDTDKFNYAKNDTPTNILTDLLSDTDFSVGTVEFTDSIIFAVNRTASIMNIIITLANKLGAEIGFSNSGFTVNLLDSLGSDNGFQIRLQKNMKGITYKVEDRGELKTAYEVDVVDIYMSREFEDMTFVETVEIGDTVQVINSVLGIDTSQAVLEIEKNVISGRNLKLTLANTFDSLADDLAFMQEEAVKKDEVIYGVKIGNDIGIEIERDDKLAKTILNADKFAMQKGDGTGSYVDSLYFDAVNEKWIFAGTVNTDDITVEGNMIIDGDGTATGIWFIGGSGANTIVYQNTIGTKPLTIAGNLHVTGDITADGTIG